MFRNVRMYYADVYSFRNTVHFSKFESGPIFVVRNIVTFRVEYVSDFSTGEKVKIVSETDVAE